MCSIELVREGSQIHSRISQYNGIELLMGDKILMHG